MKLALVLLAAVLVFVACGQAKDPFVDTWQVGHEPQYWVVIAKESNGYLVRTFRQRQELLHTIFSRHDDRLVARLPVVSNGKPTGRFDQVVIDLDTATGRVTMKDAYAVSELTRLSDSTTAPTASASP